MEASAHISEAAGAAQDRSKLNIATALSEHVSTAWGGEGEEDQNRRQLWHCRALGN